MVTGGASVTAVAAAGPGAASAPAGGGCVPPGPDSALPPPRRSGENRRSNKPIMEKRRRARINNCLNELKSLILDAMKKDPARHSKLEKADILEMTVKHLETLQRQQAAMSAATDPAVVNKFRAGFSECAGEVGRFPGLESAVRRRLLQHLANCLNGSTAAAPEAAAAPASTPASPAAAGGTPPAPAAAPTAVQVHILQPGSAAGALPAIAAGPNGGIFLATNGGPSLQLVPTRLPNGDIALVLPSANGTFRQSASTTAQSSPSTSPVPSSSSSTSSSSSSASSPLPLLIPVPQRTASTASASSTSSGSSTSSASPVAFDRLSVASPPAPNVRPPSAAPTPAPAHAPSPAVSPAVRDAATSPSAGGPVFQSRPPSRAARTPSPYEVPARPYSPPMQRPLSLVMRKTVDACSDEEKPWRPW